MTERACRKEITNLHGVLPVAAKYAHMGIWAYVKKNIMGIKNPGPSNHFEQLVAKCYTLLCINVTFIHNTSLSKRVITYIKYNIKMYI